jgi:hypothetical protein
MPRKAHGFGPHHTLFTEKGYKLWKKADVTRHPIPRTVEKSAREKRMAITKRWASSHPNDLRQILKRAR